MLSEVDINLEDITTKPPLFDVVVSDPFRRSVAEFIARVPLDVPTKASLPPIVVAELKLLDYDASKAVYIVSPELLEAPHESFGEVLTSVPLISDRELVSYSPKAKSELYRRVREMRAEGLSAKLEKLSSKTIVATLKDLPEGIYERYTIKIRVRRRISPEVRELIENSLTREFRLTRMVKRMEIVRDDRILAELENLMKSFTKKLKRY